MLEKFIKKQNNNDSIYNRRLQRGEIPDTPEFAWEKKANKIEQQKQEIQDLKIENRKLLRELDALKKQLETMEYVHSIDDLIDSMTQQKPAQTGFNPFAIFANGGATGSGDTDSGTHTEKVLAKDTFEGDVPDENDELVGEVLTNAYKDEEWEKKLQEVLSGYQFQPSSYSAGRYAARMASYCDAACRYL